MGAHDPDQVRELLRSFLARCARGESLSSLSFLREHDLGDPRLARLLDAARSWPTDELQARLAGISLEGDDDEPPAPDSATLRRTPAEVVDGRYRVVRELGRGGFGVVYLVEDSLHDDARRALKMILPVHARDPQFERRFLNEIAAMRGLTHEAIPRIYNDGRTPAGAFYYTMAYVQGRTLAEVLKASGPLAPTRIVQIVRQLLAVLDFAHGKGIVHRDLKPSNIMLVANGHGEERVRVLDFGIAKILDPDGEFEGALTQQTLGGMGTPHYMSPEQVRGTNVDGRTDLYALGIILYQMCSGLLPFSGTSHQEIATARLEQPPRPLAPDKAPEGLRSLVMRLLERERERRPDSVQVLAMLERLERSQRATSSGVRWVAAAVALLALTLVAIRVLTPRSSGSQVPATGPVTVAGVPGATGPGDGAGEADGAAAPPPGGSEGSAPIAAPEEPAGGGAGDAEGAEDTEEGRHPADARHGDPSLEVPGAAPAAGGSALGQLFLRELPAEIPLRVVAGEEEGPLSLRVDGRPVPVGQDRVGVLALDASAVPPDGRRTLRIEVGRGSGVARAFSLELIVDARAPEVRISATGSQDEEVRPAMSRPERLWTAAEAVDLQVTIEEQHPVGLRAFVLDEDGARAPIAVAPEVGGGAYRYRAVALEPGWNRLDFEAADQAGNEGVAALAIKRALRAGWSHAPGRLEPGDRRVRLGLLADGALGQVEVHGLPEDVEVSVTPSPGDRRSYTLDVVLPPEGLAFEGVVQLVDDEGDPGLDLALTLERSPPRLPAGCRRAEGASVDATGWIDRVVHDASGIELVLVPPRRPATREDREGTLYLGRSEVTWGQFLRLRREPSWEQRRAFQAAEMRLASPQELDPYPVVLLTYEEALAFAAELGLRLPSGSEWDEALGAAGDEAAPPPRPGRIQARSSAPVGTHPGDVSWCGALDMGANVEEWCTADTPGGAPMLGGGAWTNEPEAVELAAHRPPRAAPQRSETIGFRVALSAD